MIEHGDAINLHPEYQRRLRWSDVQKSRLIESLLLNIPIPPVFFYESDAARYEVMDGQQRLNAIREFFAGGYTLSGLKVLTPLNGIHYSHAPARVKRTLERASISAIVLLLESEVESTSAQIKISDIRRLVFDRLNTGGMKLNAQELRNAQNPGPFNDAIISITRNHLFTDVFGIPPYTEINAEDYYNNPTRQKNNLYSSMKDCELVLRYFALKSHDNIRGSMKSMLDRAMETKMNQEESMKAIAEYNSAFEFLYYLFDQRPFEIPSGRESKNRVSAAVYDAFMVAANDLRQDWQTIFTKKSQIQERVYQNLKDPSRYEILTGRGNTADSVKQRIKLSRDILSY